jgi:hypothetical protein
MALPDFPMPREQRYFEDYIAGSVFEYGSIPVDATEIAAFKREYGAGPVQDHAQNNVQNSARKGPQTGANADCAAQTASEWHVVGLMMRLLAGNFLPKEAIIASPGLDELRWHKPVQAGDSVWIRTTIVDAQRSRSKPSIGNVRLFVEAFNQRGELVLSLRSMNLMRCRTSAAAE